MTTMVYYHDSRQNANYGKNTHHQKTSQDNDEFGEYIREVLRVACPRIPQISTYWIHTQKGASVYHATFENADCDASANRRRRAASRYNS